MKGAVLVDNKVGMFNMILFPPGATHRYAHKSARISDSLVIGTAGTDCDSLPDVSTIILLNLTLRKRDHFARTVFVSIVGGGIDSQEAIIHVPLG